jgi:predicted nuclease of predicted toxin-antitoxin system
MAYKSRVTNKYMGSTFAGRVNSATKSDATDLVNILQKDVNPAISRIMVAEVEKKKDTATQKMNELMLTKDADTIQKEILSGQHPELSGKYVEKTVEYHNGKIQAVDAIKKIEENKSNYDFLETNLPAFYKQYLPSFADKNGSYTLGFSSVFNEYKAKEAIKDAEVRSQYAYTKKINDNVKIVLNGEEGTEWDIINKGLDYKLPPEEGGTTSRMFLTNTEKNDVALESARFLLDTATSSDDIDRALKILSAPRGIGKDGMNLGSLVSTKRSDVSDLVKKLNNKRVSLVTTERIQNEYQENLQKKDLIKNLFENNPDGSEKSFAQKQEILENAKSFGDITFYNSINNIITSDISQVNDNPDELSDFMNNVLEGGFTSLTDMIKEFDSKRFSQDHLSKAITYYNTYETRYEKGLKPIHQTDETYTTSMAYILDAVSEPFRDKLGNIMKGGEYAQYRARNYMISTITEEENKFKEENGRAPTALERQKIITEIGDYVIKQFSTRQKDIELLSFTDIEKIEQDKEVKRQALEEKYKNVGLDVPLSNLQTALQNKNNIPELPKMETSFFKSKETERQEYLTNTVLPTVQDFLTKSFGVQLTPSMWEALSNEDAQNVYGNVANAFKIDPKVVQVVIGNILRGQQ